MWNPRYRIQTLMVVVAIVAFLIAAGYELLQDLIMLVIMVGGTIVLCTFFAIIAAVLFSGRRDPPHDEL